MKKTIRCSAFGNETYECHYDWPDDCFCQSGTKGIVFSRSKGNYTTAFFEAFPKNPNTFIRGEGGNVFQAEQQAWNSFQRFQACPNHEYERRDYTNGAGFCKHCNLFAPSVFEPSTLCIICDAPTNWSTDKDGAWYCEKHHAELPDEMLLDYQVEMRETMTRLKGERIDDERPNL